MFPPFTSDAAVTFELVVYQPWPTSEILKIGEVVFGHEDAFVTSDAFFRLAARVELPDDCDDALVDRARGILRGTLDLLRQALPRYTLEFGMQHHIQRLEVAGGTGKLEVPATVCIIVRTPLPADDLMPARELGRTFSGMNETQQRRSRAAAYWLEQSRVAPDAAQRVPAACFAIESAISASGDDKMVQQYFDAIVKVGFALSEVKQKRLKERLKSILEMRASVVHHGHLDKPAKNPQVERWARDLANTIVREKLGLALPSSLAILDENLTS